MPACPSGATPRLHVAVVASTATSHMRPHLPVVSELVRRGHRVTYLVGSALAHLATPTGARVVACTSVLPGVGGPRSTWPDDPVAGMRLFLDEGMHALPQVHAALDDDPPGVVLYDIGGFAGPVAAARWGIPTVQLSPTFVAWDGYEEEMAPVMGPVMATAAGVDYTATYDRWLADEGVPLTRDDINLRPPRSLALVPRVMQPHADRVGDRYRFVGPCLEPSRFDPDGWQPPAGDGPLAYMAFGTAYNDRTDLYRACIEAFDGTGWRLVVATGSPSRTADLGAAASWVQAVTVAPQVAVLQRADVFLTHAGMGSCSEALWCGVPTVAIPQAVDQFENAAHLESLGVGRHLTEKVPDPATIRTAALELANDPAVAERLAGIRADLHAGAGVVSAADAVEDVVAGRW